MSPPEPSGGETTQSGGIDHLLAHPLGLCPSLHDLPAQPRVGQQDVSRDAASLPVLDALAIGNAKATGKLHRPAEALDHKGIRVQGVHRAIVHTTKVSRVNFVCTERREDADNRRMSSMHESTGRLYAAAAKLVPPISGPTELAAALSVSKQSVTNWRSRGVSKEGAIEAQRVLGINLDWVLQGQLPMFIAAAEAPAAQSQSARQQRQILRDASKLVRLVLDGNIPLTDEQKEDLSDRAIAIVSERWGNGFPSELDAYKAALELVARVQSR